MIKIEQPNFRAKFVKCLYQNIKEDDNYTTKDVKDISFEELEADQTQN